MFWRVLTLKRGSIGTEGRSLQQPTPMLLNLELATGVEPLTTGGSLISFGASRPYYVEQDPVECFGDTILRQDLAKEWEQRVRSVTVRT